MNEQLLTIDEAAARLAVHPNTIRNMIDRGELASVVLRRRKNGFAGRRMIAASTLDALIAANTEGRITDGN